MKSENKEVYFICLFGKDKLSNIPAGTATRIKRKAMDEYRTITNNIAVNDFASFELSEKKFKDIMGIISRYDSENDPD
jgi:hypothetical protein